MSNINRYPDGRSYKKPRNNLNETATEKHIKHEGKKHKYGAKETFIDGRRFPTKKEAKHYMMLKQMKMGGYIKDFTMQNKYELQEGFINSSGKKIQSICYIDDFFITCNNDKTFPCDSKGMETPVFKLKKKMFEYKFGYPIILFKKDGDIHRLAKENDPNGKM